MHLDAFVTGKEKVNVHENKTEETVKQRITEKEGGKRGIWNQEALCTNTHTHTHPHTTVRKSGTYCRK